MTADNVRTVLRAAVQLAAWHSWYINLHEEEDFHNWALTTRPDLDVIRYACYESTLLNWRKLVEFFCHPPNRPDDLRAANIQFETLFVDNSATRSKVNKLIAHPTSDSDDITFLMDTIATPLLLETVRFIDFLLNLDKWEDEFVAELRWTRITVTRFQEDILTLRESFDERLPSLNPPEDRR